LHKTIFSSGILQIPNHQHCGIMVRSIYLMQMVTIFSPCHNGAP